jgi:hypothetical protein
MKYTTNIQDIEKILVGRAALEQELALDLSKVFKEGVLSKRINAAVEACFRCLKGLESQAAIKPTIELCETKNAFLFETNPKTIDGVLTHYQKGGQFNPEQCGSLIRFYGEVVQDCANYGHDFLKERAKQIAWRYGGGGETFKAGRDPNYEAKADKGIVWRKTGPIKEEDAWMGKAGAEGKGGPKKIDELHPLMGAGSKHTDTPYIPVHLRPGGRIRIKPEDFFKKGEKDPKPNPYYDIIPGNLFQNQELKKLHIGKKFGGAMEWKMQDSSTLGIIDRVFGLPFGADISGTTCDELYFLTGWADASKGDPLVMMLPLAVIVGEYHHALLEVAAAMSLRKVVSYCIGFYTTLLPPLPGGVAPLPQRADVAALLKRIESDPRNQHILLHYNKNQKIAGCFIAEGNDLGGFKKLGTVDIHLWPQFNDLPAYPPEDKIMGLLADVGLANAVLASRRGALRGPGASLEMEQKRLEKKLGFAA